MPPETATAKDRSSRAIPRTAHVEKATHQRYCAIEGETGRRRRASIKAADGIRMRPVRALSTPRNSLPFHSGRLNATNVLAAPRLTGNVESK
jgi:hypothetical protein